jgi:glycosyltransferase involved in cell wall biosynthesis
MRCPRLTELPSPPAGKTGWPWTEASPPLPNVMPGGRPWPRISIVTPSFNQGEFLEATIRSVLLQGYPDVECVVVDGGSRDTSVEIIKRYAQWLAYWCSEPDRGSANALNKGFAQTTGEILGCLNSDDFYLPGCFREIASVMHARSAAGVVYGNGYFASASGRLEKPIFSDRWSLHRFAYRPSMLVQQATFFRREAFQKIKGFNEANRSCWDAEFCADLALAGAEFHHIGEFLAAFRIYADSITGSGRLRHQFREDIRRIFEKIVGRPETAADRVYRFALRLQRFSAHPFRTLGYKLFYRSVLGRWSL